MAEGLEGKTKEEWIKAGAKPTNLPNYLCINVDGTYQILKLNEKENKYYPTKANQALDVSEKGPVAHNS
jgi:hypothetical protein